MIASAHGVSHGEWQQDAGNDGSAAILTEWIHSTWCRVLLQDANGIHASAYPVHQEREEIVPMSPQQRGKGEEAGERMIRRPDPGCLPDIGG